MSPEARGEGDPEEHRSVAGYRDFRRLWAGTAVSQVGSAVGSVALPVVAVSVVGASTLQVSAISASGALAAAALALPAGAWVEHRRKRPVMIGADVVRAAALLSLLGAWWWGAVTVTQLCLVAAVTAVGQLVFVAASQAHLPALVGRDHLVDANGRLQSTTWLALTVGPSSGGVLVAALGPWGALAADAGSFLIGVLGVRAIRAAEPPPPTPADDASVAVRRRWSEVTAGLGFVCRHPTLGPMLVSWTLFAGAVAWVTPLSTVFYLRELGASAWQYGLLMGLPSLGGFVGARLTRRLVQSRSPVRLVRTASLARGPWQLVVPFAGAGPAGLVLCGVGFTGVLLFGGAANAAMAAHRQLVTPVHLMSRVTALWSAATVVVAPFGAVVGGLVATAASVRMSLVLGAVLVCAAALVLPRDDTAADDSHTRQRS